jgi:hypothetical protein
LWPSLRIRLPRRNQLVALARRRRLLSASCQHALPGCSRKVNGDGDKIKEIFGNNFFDFQLTPGA